MGVVVDILLLVFVVRVFDDTLFDEYSKRNKILVLFSIFT